MAFSRNTEYVTHTDLIVIYFVHREKMQIEAARHEQEQNKLLEEALSVANQASVAKKYFFRICPMISVLQ